MISFVLFESGPEVGPDRIGRLRFVDIVPNEYDLPEIRHQ